MRAGQKDLHLHDPLVRALPTIHTHTELRRPPCLPQMRSKGPHLTSGHPRSCFMWPCLPCGFYTQGYGCGLSLGSTSCDLMWGFFVKVEEALLCFSSPGWVRPKAPWSLQLGLCSGCDCKSGQERTGHVSIVARSTVFKPGAGTRLVWPGTSWINHKLRLSSNHEITSFLPLGFALAAVSNSSSWPPFDWLGHSH